MTRTRRALAVLAAVALAAGLAGCSSSTANTSATPAHSGAADSAAFPVTIKSALGSVTITHRPTRVATWGWGAQDDALALGVVPVAMPDYVYGGNKDKVLPWDAAAIAKLGAKTPTLLSSDTDQVPFEQFAAARPDIILAPYSGLTQADYDTLSKIAPVVAYPDKPWSTSWQDQLSIIGRALGKSVEATALQKKVDGDIAALSAKYPVLHGKTFVYGAANQPGQLNVYRADDPRVQLLEQLGMKLSPSVGELGAGQNPSSYFYGLSYEKLDQIHTDMLVGYFANQQAADAFAKTPVVAQMASVRDGHFAPVVGESFVMASSAPSALSIPWMLDRYVPQLAKAAAH